jgi:hypothetical protein
MVFKNVFFVFEHLLNSRDPILAYKKDSRIGGFIVGEGGCRINFSTRGLIYFDGPAEKSLTGPDSSVRLPELKLKKDLLTIGEG